MLAGLDLGRVQGGGGRLAGVVSGEGKGGLAAQLQGHAEFLYPERSWRKMMTDLRLISHDPATAAS